MKELFHHANRKKIKKYEEEKFVNILERFKKKHNTDVRRFYLFNK